MNAYNDLFEWVRYGFNEEEEKELNVRTQTPEVRESNPTPPLTSSSSPVENNEAAEEEAVQESDEADEAPAAQDQVKESTQPSGASTEAPSSEYASR